MNLRLSFIALSLLLLFSCQNKSENPLQELTEEDIHSLNMYFYPSTIRMINLGKDTAFYKATKDIDRIQFLSISLSDSAKSAFFLNWQKEQDFEEWDELMKANMDGSLVTVMAPKSSDDRYYAVMQSKDIAYLLWAEGKVDLNEAMKVMNNGLDLGPVSNFLDNKDKDKKRKEVKKKARDEQRKLEGKDSTITE